MAGPRWLAPPWLCISFAVVSLVLLSFDSKVGSTESSRAEHVKKIWQQDEPLLPGDIKKLRQEAWNMFDFGFSNYMNHAFPKDNLLPLSCQGENWQGGIAMTLVDSLDALLIMNRRADLEVAVSLLRQHLTFDKEVKVHVFETVIRELGGLLSGHMLLMRDPSLVSDYDGLFLRKATDLADKLLPAFDTASGLPTLWVNLDGSPVKEENNNITCTACAGTLLLEFGVLSQLTGNSIYREKAEHAAQVVYAMRSKLGLVGGSLDTNTSAWVRKDSTIGPGIDSYYEYLLKAYIMFGERKYLDMFVELYTATMQHMTLPGNLNGYSFLVDVHMDNGRLSHPWVSSLGAFWPAMQVLAGQEGDAVQLHSNFTAAWQRHGWLPEVFNVDLSQAQVHPEDPGYNLRPEHIESTYLLHSYTRDPRYIKVARDILRALQVNKVKCGFASITNVQTGEHGNIMESFFLSETMKYLYLLFMDSPPLTEYYILSTEGHLLPTFASESDDSFDPEELGELPENCRKLCQKRSGDEERQNLLRLQSAFPLIKFDSMDATTIRSRTCIACVQTTKYVQRIPQRHPMERAAALGISPQHVSPQPVPSAHKSSPLRKIVAQLLCTIKVSLDGTFRCGTVRSITPEDIQKGLPHNGLVLQLSQVQADPIHSYALIHGLNGSSAQLPAAPAEFGGSIPQVMERCLKALRFSPGNRHGTCPAAPVFLDLRSRTCPSSIDPQPLAVYKKLSRYMLVRNITAATAADDHSAHIVEPPGSHGPVPTPDSLSPSESPASKRERERSTSTSAPAHGAQGHQNAAHGAQGHQNAAHGAQGHQNAADVHQRGQEPSDCMTDQQQATGACVGGVERADRNRGAEGAVDGVESIDTDQVAESSADAEQGVAVEHSSEGSTHEEQGVAVEHVSEGITHGEKGVDAKHVKMVDEQGLKRKRACDVGTDLSWGRMVMADPPLGCSQPENAKELEGAVAVVLRGECAFLDKALLMQHVGASAVLVLNTGKTPGPDLLSMAGDGTARTAQVHIPALLLGRKIAYQVLHWMQQYPLTATFVAHRPSAEPGAQIEYTPRVDLLVPVSSQGWIQRIASLQNLDVNAMFEGVLSDAQALELLWAKASADKKNDQQPHTKRNQASASKSPKTAPQTCRDSKATSAETELGAYPKAPGADKSAASQKEIPRSQSSDTAAAEVNAESSTAPMAEDDGLTLGHGQDTVERSKRQSGLERESGDAAPGSCKVPAEVGSNSGV